MSEEITAEATEEEAALPNTDDATPNTGADGVTEEGTQEEGQTEEIAAKEEGIVPDEPVDNRTRSQLGRRVSTLEDSFATSTRELKDSMDRLIASNNQANYVDDSEDILSTKGEIRDFINSERAKDNETTSTAATQTQIQYEKGYLETIRDLGTDVSEEEEDEIYNEVMTKAQNIKHSDNPVRDAAKNWARAARAVANKKAANPVRKNPLKGDKPMQPLGGGSGQSMTEKTVKIPKFDEATQDYMKRMNISPEKAAKMLAQGG